MSVRIDCAVINRAGLGAQAEARRLGVPESVISRRHLAKGS